MDNNTDALLVDRSAKTLRQLALEKLRTAILELKFQPGERLVERALCERLGVSRSVVREVLRHLESEGLVEGIPGHGPAVARPDPGKISQIYELRSILEAMAAKYCAAQATQADITRMRQALDAVRAGYAAGSFAAVLAATTLFYETMFLAAGRDVAWDVVTSLNGRITHLRATTIATPGRDKDGAGEMQAILDAIEARDGAAAQAASAAHLHNALQLALVQARKRN
ncbi:GntR family transcriptional regulator [Acidocella aquatica]|uniref:GntR family transcriptional regulator n=1 Tax=Acidocella aquatica TaxID=1922313 RepID=A0ABQ6A2G5_9PROT|nr:GntR family transcriptional regulator [Acidocella aquatica]GLR65502.1 GntR family transcriptional regulator [Acidocella aquatica]